MKAEISQISYGIGSLILGGIIGAIVENELTTGIHIKDLVLFSLTITLFILVMFFYDILEKGFNHNKEVISEVKTITKRLGLKVDYQDLKHIGKNKKQEDLLAKIIHSADFEILELSRSEVHEAAINPDLPDNPVRKLYYDKLLEHVERQVSSGSEFTYKRMIQFPSLNKNFSSLKDEIYLTHCKQMIKLNLTNNIQTYVKKTLLTFPLSFLIIDRKYLILSIDTIKHKETISTQHLKGEVIIYDPQQELIKVFLDEWLNIENSPYTHTVTLSDF